MAKAYPRSSATTSWQWPAKARLRCLRSRRTSGSRKERLSNWLKRAAVEDGNRPVVTEKQSVEVRELKKRNRLLEQENEVLRSAAAYLSQANLPGRRSSRSSVKMAATDARIRVPVAVACTVLGLTTAGHYKRLKVPSPSGIGTTHTSST